MGQEGGQDTTRISNIRRSVKRGWSEWTPDLQLEFDMLLALREGAKPSDLVQESLDTESSPSKIVQSITKHLPLDLSQIQEGIFLITECRYSRKWKAGTTYQSALADNIATTQSRLSLYETFSQTSQF